MLKKRGSCALMWNMQEAYDTDRGERDN